MHVSFLVLRMQVDASLNEDADLSQKNVDIIENDTILCHNSSCGEL